MKAAKMSSPYIYSYSIHKQQLNKKYLGTVSFQRRKFQERSLNLLQGYNYFNHEKR